MNKQIQIAVPVDIAYKEDKLKIHLQQLLKEKEFAFKIRKRSVDARAKIVKINLYIDIYINETVPNIKYTPSYPAVQNNKQAIIVGAGPAGMFAALRLIELGIKPIILERGKDVRERRRDLAAINKEHIVNADSNYCFGEGGAGTYSDGKLYTRSKKRGDINRILEILVGHGATEEILVDAHPHIGTNKLPKVVENIRNSILNAGGEIHFNKRVTELIIQSGELKGVITQDQQQWNGIGVILATGHSARDIFELLHRHNIFIQAKPFALGVRIEHQQSLIDSIQYHCDNRGPYLPAASYSLVEQTNYQNKQRGVFSFCMCPGGFIVPSATAPGELVVNGMSPSRRDSKFSNSGMVVAIELEDVQRYAKDSIFAALEFQKTVEQKAFNITKSQKAPAQRMVDFVNKKYSNTLLETSYQPGLQSTLMDEFLPDFVTERMRQAFKKFNNKMNGYYTNEAQIIGVESRTSSPISIPRDKTTFEHIKTKRLFPCGEGAGYAGGIMSAAIDGEKCAEALVKLYK